MSAGSKHFKKLDVTDDNEIEAEIERLATYDHVSNDTLVTLSELLDLYEQENPTRITLESINS